MTAAAPVVVHGDVRSGNCYKVKLLLELLGRPYRWVPVDVTAGETRTPDFLKLNPAGKVPVLVLSDGRTLPESNAILHYLAEGTPFLPDDRFERARVLAWQFFEQYSHEPYIAVARYIAVFLGLPDDRRAEYESKQEGGHRALGVLERSLAGASYLVGDRPTIADLSLYAYTHVAHEGGFDLDGYPGVRAWIVRIAALPGHVPIG